MKNILKISAVALLTAFVLLSCKNEQAIDSSNPFLGKYDTPFDVPPFEKIRVKHYMPAFEKGIGDARKDIKAIIDNRKSPTFENTIVALDNQGELLDRVASVFFPQSSAATNDSIQDIEIKISPMLAAFSDEITLNPDLFKKVKAVYDNQAEFKLTSEEKYLLENMYKGFIRNGANLAPADQDTLRALNQKLAVLTVQVSQNVLAETNNYKLVLNEEDLAGLPQSVIDGAAEAAKASGNEGKWIFSTQRPSMYPFLQYSTRRDLRKKLYDAYTNRGNNGNEYDNNMILAEIIRLRAQRAKLLGYKTHSHVVLEPRMAKVPENVFELLNSLWEKSLPVAKNEVREMQAIINREGGRFKLEPSDWWYYAEKLRKAKYDLDDTELRPYFQLENVREGVFYCSNKLFGITFTPINNIPLPHPEAQAYEVKEADGSHLGVLYMDFHPRESKQQGAWCGSYRNHHVLTGTEIYPVVTVVCNFTRPSGELPSLLSMEEVTTFFHEFGHALENLFNKNTYNQTYVAWDFVEVPSQLNEHWAVEPEVLNMYAKNHKTGEVIPADLVTKIRNSAYFNQGFETVEYLAASLLDLSYHTLEDPANIDVQDFEKEYFTKIGLIPEIISRYRSTYFLHIMGGYDSGYYSYIWAAVLDNDAYEAFRENGIFDKETADSYRRNILEKNGIMDPMEMYVNFRGREPVIEPLLKKRGLIPENQSR